MSLLSGLALPGFGDSTIKSQLMEYYFLDFLVNNEIYFSEHTPVQPDSWLRGRHGGDPLELPIKILLTKSKGEGKLVEHLYNNGQLLEILREDLARVIEKREPHIQLVEVELQQESEHKYFYVHTLDNLVALDLESSEAIPLIEGVPVYTEIKNLTLLPDVVAGRHLFRIKAVSSLLIVSKALKEELEGVAPLEYLKFTPCQGYHWELSPDPVKQIESIRKD